MSEFKGTSGPWGVYNDTIIESELGGFICDVCGDSTSWEDDKNNAKLMAAAPDLLDAVNLILDLQTRGFIVLGDKHTGTLQASVNRALGKINEDK